MSDIFTVELSKNGEIEIAFNEDNTHKISEKGAMAIRVKIFKVIGEKRYQDYKNGVF